MNFYHLMKHRSDSGRFLLRPALTSVLVAACLLACSISAAIPAKTSAKSSALILLNHYSRTMKIGGEFYLTAFSTDGSLPSFKSSKSSVASVNTYGLVTAKSAGSCKITAKVKGAEASCKITVSKTVITLNQSSLSLENGSIFRLTAKTSNGSAPSYTSSKKSVAEVSDTGIISAKKPGTATISVKADKTTAKCKVTVKSPTVKLNHTSISLYRKHSIQLHATVSSGIAPVWKSSKSSVASVDENGTVTAYKHGTAIIRATVDGVTKTCEVTVKSPSISLSHTVLTLKAGKTAKLTAKVSSGNQPAWKSSRSSVASVSQSGKITAKKAGSATITVSEDGSSQTCLVQVTSANAKK